jgi:tetratricopeptide (TPR) repeat protein
MQRTTSILMLALLLVLCFSLATLLQPRAATWSRSAQSGSVLKVLLGDGRRLFARHFYEQADVSFHSGYYPTIFDVREKPKVSPMAGGHAEHDEAEHERQMAMGQPHDWIEAFGRHFRVTEHTHLEHGQEREILPWLRLSAELDPQRVETYTVASYWLCKRLGKVKEAEEFLRDGLRNNPNSHEILYELGRLYAEEKGEADRARNIWDLALARWTSQEAGKKEPDLFQLEQIAVHLATLEDQAGNYQRAIGLFELAKQASPHPIDLENRIEEIRRKMSAPTKPN